MLTAQGCAARRAALVERTDANLIIITNPRHIQYFSGLYISETSLSAYGRCFLLIDPYQSNKSTLIVHNFLADDAAKAHVDEVVMWTWYDAAKKFHTTPHRGGVDELNLQLPIGATGIAAEKGWLPWDIGISEFTDITDTILDLRRSKHADERALILEAIEAIGAGHAAARQAIQPGMTELDMYNLVHAAIVNKAGTPILMLGDFASGDRANQGGGPATPRKLKAGELMIFDLFPVINGYKGDFTATLSADGSMTVTQTKLQDAVHAGLTAAEAMLKPGAKCAQIHAAMKDGLGSVDAMFAEGFGHHAGHGLGLGHPEAPYIVPESDESLRAGDIITLEPGSYNIEKGFGARIEHNYLITENGFQRLSSHDTKFA